LVRNQSILTSQHYTIRSFILLVQQFVISYRYSANDMIYRHIVAHTDYASPQTQPRCRRTCNTCITYWHPTAAPFCASGPPRFVVGHDAGMRAGVVGRLVLVRKRDGDDDGSGVGNEALAERGA